MDGWMDGWVYGRTDGRTDHLILIFMRRDGGKWGDVSSTLRKTSFPSIQEMKKKSWGIISTIKLHLTGNYEKKMSSDLKMKEKHSSGCEMIKNVLSNSSNPPQKSTGLSQTNNKKTSH